MTHRKYIGLFTRSLYVQNNYSLIFFLLMLFNDWYYSKKPDYLSPERINQAPEEGFCHMNNVTGGTVQQSFVFILQLKFPGDPDAGSQYLLINVQINTLQCPEVCWWLSSPNKQHKVAAIKCSLSKPRLADNATTSTDLLLWMASGISQGNKVIHCLNV